MRVGVFSAKGYDRSSLGDANTRAGTRHELVFLDARLSGETASLGAGFPAVCVFVNDRLDAEVLAILAAGRTRLVVLRCAGYNNVDEILQDDTFARLLTFPNVVVTGHQAFFTETALGDIAATTIANLTAFELGQPLVNAVG